MISRDTGGKMEQNNKNKQLLEEYNEAMITHAAKLLALEQEEEAERLFEEYSALPTPEYSEEFKLNIKELLKNSDITADEPKKGKILPFRKKLISAAACILGVFVIGGTVLSVSSDAFLEHLKYLVGKNFSTHTSFVAETAIPDRFKQRMVAAGWETILYPSYLPEGFELVEVECNKLRYNTIFSNDTQELNIECSRIAKSTKYLFDSENNQNEILYINGIKAEYTAKENHKHLAFIIDKNIVYVTSINMDKLQTIDIAKSITEIIISP